MPEREPTDELAKQITKDLEEMVGMGLVDFTVNEEGEFLFSLTPLGKVVYAEMREDEG